MAAKRFKKVPVLRSRAEFVRIQTEGRRFRKNTVMLLVGRASASSGRLGITVSRKVGCAVVRNRVRRRVREIVRTHPESLNPGWDYVVIASPSAARVGFATLSEELLCVLDQARVWARPRS